LGCLLETLGIEYRYEPEGFELEGGIRYLPDFYLPKLKVWVEIKPGIPTPEEREKAIQLCISTRNVVALFSGDVWSDVKVFTFSPLVHEGSNASTDIDDIKEIFAGSHICWISTDECIIADGDNFMCGIDYRRGFCWATSQWAQCAICNSISIIGIGVGLFCSCPNADLETGTSDLREAYEAARQARF